MAELADALDLGSNTLQCAGSSPVSGTKFLIKEKIMIAGLIITTILYVALMYFSYAWLDGYINELLKNKFNISSFDIWMCVFLGMLPILMPVIGNLFMILFLGIIDNKNRD